MPASIGVNLRVTGHCRQGGRRYMEDYFSVAYQQTEDERDLEYAFIGIFDGHGGPEAALYAKDHLMEAIVRERHFWSDNDEDVLRAIKDGYIATHYAMWREQEKWPRTASGLPSTAGTTASVAFIRRGKIYIGHVGDSGIVLGCQEPGAEYWTAKALTKDHKPENDIEIQRIEQSGGKVVAKSGVPRVVWNRPRLGHQGPVLRSTPIDEIPFLAVARSLGDLWSYNYQNDEFVVSPDPDCSVIAIDISTFRCIIFGTDGLFNMLCAQTAVNLVQQAELHNENATLQNRNNPLWINPSKCLVEKALDRWYSTNMTADNTSVVTLLLDPPGPPRVTVLKNRTSQEFPDSGLKILTRYISVDRTADAAAPDADIVHTHVDDVTIVKEPLEPDPVDTKAKGALPDMATPTTSAAAAIESVQINEVSSSSSGADDVKSLPRPISTTPTPNIVAPPPTVVAPPPAAATTTVVTRIQTRLQEKILKRAPAQKEAATTVAEESAIGSSNNNNNNNNGGGKKVKRSARFKRSTTTVNITTAIYLSTRCRTASKPKMRPTRANLRARTRR